MPRLRRRATASRSARTPWHPRACVRQAVALRVDYVTAQGQVGLGLIRNLSLKGMYMESTSGHGTPAMTPGDLAQHVVECHRRLAEMGGANRVVFGPIAEQLAAELEDRGGRAVS